MSASIECFMRAALDLAKKGMGRTFPNPCVGAVVVRGGRIVGGGFHKRAGGAHAEIRALQEAGDRARGGVLFSTLEPCVHHGRTGPCVEAVMAAGIRRVYIGMVDPNPLVMGKGVVMLRRAGIAVTTGVLEKECRALNEPFVKAMTRGLPFVTIKIAESLDGKTATASGESKWITGEDARRHARRMRGFFDAILVGVRTVLADDPRLEPAASAHKVAKVVVDSTLKIPSDARLLDTRHPVFVATTSRDPRKRTALEKRKAVIIRTPSRGGRVDLRYLLRELGRREIRHVLVEGGSEITGSFLDEKLADEACVYLAAKIIGGRAALSAVGGRGVVHLADAVRLKNPSLRRFKNDFLMEGRLEYGRARRRG